MLFTRFRSIKNIKCLKGRTQSFMLLLLLYCHHNYNSLLLMMLLQHLGYTLGFTIINLNKCVRSLFSIYTHKYKDWIRKQQEKFSDFYNQNEISSFRIKNFVKSFLGFALIYFNYDFFIQVINFFPQKIKLKWQQQHNTTCCITCHKTL